MNVYTNDHNQSKNGCRVLKCFALGNDLDLILKKGPISVC